MGNDKGAMAAPKAPKGQGLTTNRIELIHIITDLIEASDVKVIQDRDDAAMLAISVVDGLQQEAESREVKYEIVKEDISQD